jgi:3-deoxy-manno-octulosonate cytidylyltransferase (CMP-KDO synthetase)
MEQFIGIIPARYASTRFPAKPLAVIAGKLMIQRVYERASAILEHVVVASDDVRIIDAVKDFGGKAVMTSEKHRSGTDRCAEALGTIVGMTGINFSVVINIQGDEPFIRSEQIDTIKKCFDDRDTQIATLIKRIDNSSIIFDPNKPKVIIDRHGFALYFSRSPIPYLRDFEKDVWHKKHNFFQHIGMYAYRTNVLHEIAHLLPGELEKAESLEQLRWLENGYRIKAAITEFESFGIDTPEDLKKAISMGLVD